MPWNLHKVSGATNPDLIETVRREMIDQPSAAAWCQFDAWRDAPATTLIFWLDTDEDGAVLAYMRTDDRDPACIAFFETRYHGSGIGTQIIEALKEERQDWTLGEIDNMGCARFWARHGFDVAGVTLSDGRMV